MNRHGLARDIPEGVKRIIRQACFNGCVICGKIPYTYEHFNPPFEDSTQHDPDGMALLCGIHQLDRTAGRLSINAVSSARINPFNKTHDPKFLTHFPEDMKLNLFGNSIAGPSVGFSINEQVIFGIKVPTEPDAVCLMTGTFCDPSGKETIRFVDNEVIARNGNWDITFEGRQLTVRSRPGSIVAQLSFDPENNVIDLSRLEMRLANNHFLQGTPTGISISGPQLQLSIYGISGSYVTGDAFSYGPALTGQFSTIGVNDPRLGTFEDWRSCSGSKQL